MRAQRERQLVVSAGLELVNEGLVARTWGNVSCRVDGDVFAITPSGLGYDRISAEDIAVYNAADGTYEGARKPSSEKRIHAAAYKIFPDASFVIHTHQTYASALGLAGFDDLRLQDEEKSALGGVALAGYGLPGTKRLAKNVERALKTGAHTVLMSHHGALIIGRDSQEAFERAKLLEGVCKRACRGQEGEKGDETRAERLSGLAKAKFAHACCTVNGAVVKVAGMGGVCAQLDDMAQMIGAKLISLDGANKRGVLLALEKYDAVLVKGVGAVCRAAAQGDCEALRILVEKSCVCRLHTAHYGANAKLPALEARLMRLVYLKKYSKKIGE